MAESKPSHIQVHGFEEPEIVIEAGLSAAPEGGQALEARALATPAQGREEEAAEASLASSVKPARKKVRQTSRDDYQPTTLEDLKSTSMSTAQKVIIIAAVVGLVVFVVWYAVTYLIV